MNGVSGVPRLALHGHAYQPPRTDRRSGVVPVEASASPYRDWNHRITAECYAPCTATRLHDAQGRVTAIVNLFERLSFDLGPTLAHWLAVHAPVVHDRIVAADRVGRTAIAHPYHHVILPLADPADARTELCWGLADFRHRFGREAEGMWLPETAVDEATLRLLDDLGVAFTVLAPHQVERVPPAGAVGRRGGAGPLLVVYDGPISHGLAFGAALGSADALADRLTVAAGGRFAVAATDLETFGHHHRFSERAVGHLLFDEAAERGFRTGGLAALIDGLDVSDVGRVYTSAWSCAHGVERWRNDCGCATDGGPGSHQRWRAPLRAALGVLHDHARSVYARHGATVFFDPPAARDAYGEVLADPSAWDGFVERHLRPVASEEQAALLLAAQEASLASFTSCAWFFADLARREVAIVIQEAARAADLAARVGEPAPLEAALILLDAAEGLAGGPSGRAVWDWALAEPSPSPGVGEDGWTWDRTTELGMLAAELATVAVSGDPAASEAARRARELAAAVGLHDGVFRQAQETIYAALADRAGPAPSEEVVALGVALGLAVSAR